MVWTLLSLMLAHAPKVGELAPDVTLTTTEGEKITLSHAVTKGPVVLAFFPKAFTLGCTQELKAFQARFSELSATGATLIAISTDDVDALKRFRAELKAQYPFVSDAQGFLVSLFDTKFLWFNIASRRTFVIGPDMKITAILEGSDAVDVSPAIMACSKQQARAGEPLAK